MYLIVGLGNPTEEYKETRHNIGFKVVEEFIKLTNIKELKNKRKCKALVGEGELSGRKIIVAQPQTFMNLSGESVLLLLKWYKIETNKLIVAYDDVDLDVGKLRIRMGGSSGGHHGVDSIIESIKTSDFIRVRIGIGRDSFTKDVSDYVLSKVPDDQIPLINQAIINAAYAIEAIIVHGLDYAMNKFSK